MEDPGSVWRRIPILAQSALENSTQVIKLLDIVEFVILYLKKKVAKKMFWFQSSVSANLCVKHHGFKKNENMRKYNIV